mmetsp:Transcript_38169/g.115443  ORF Transcript_38169/g.115443 Transcript_38169/m.115443 type:complete len:264 (+) Transcript_38169:415-1206(+)
MAPGSRRTRRAHQRLEGCHGGRVLARGARRGREGVAGAHWRQPAAHYSGDRGPLQQPRLQHHPRRIVRSHRGPPNPHEGAGPGRVVPHGSLRRAERLHGGPVVEAQREDRGGGGASAGDRAAPRGKGRADEGEPGQGGYGAEGFAPQARRGRQAYRGGLGGMAPGSRRTRRAHQRLEGCHGGRVLARGARRGREGVAGAHWRQPAAQYSQYRGAFQEPRLPYHPRRFGRSHYGPRGPGERGAHTRDVPQGSLRRAEREHGGPR